jgi:hypothetical protein
LNEEDFEGRLILEEFEWPEPLKGDAVVKLRLCSDPESGVFEVYSFSSRYGWECIESLDSRPSAAKMKEDYKERLEPNRLQAILDAAEKLGQTFLQLSEVAEVLRAFDGGNALDPSLLWHVQHRRCNKDVCQVMLFEDWYSLCTTDGGTVDELARYLEKRWKSPRAHADRINSVFRTNWSKALIEQGNWLFISAIPGLRRRDKSGRAFRWTTQDDVPKHIAELAATHYWVPLLREHIKPTRLLLCPDVTIGLRETFPEIDHFKLWGHCWPAAWGGYWPGPITDHDDPHQHRTHKEIMADIYAEEAEEKRIGEELALTHKTQWMHYVGAEIKETMRSTGIINEGQLARWYDEVRNERPEA